MYLSGSKFKCKETNKIITYIVKSDDKKLIRFEDGDDYYIVGFTDVWLRLNGSEYIIKSDKENYKFFIIKKEGEIQEMKFDLVEHDINNDE